MLQTFEDLYDEYGGSGKDMVYKTYVMFNETFAEITWIVLTHHLAPISGVGGGIKKLLLTNTY